MLGIMSDLNWGDFGIAGLVICALFVIVKYLIDMINGNNKNSCRSIDMQNDLKICITNNTLVMQSVIKSLDGVIQIVRSMEISNTRIEQKQNEILDRFRSHE